MAEAETRLLVAFVNLPQTLRDLSFRILFVKRRPPDSVQSSILIAPNDNRLGLIADELNTALKNNKEEQRRNT